MTDFFLRAKPWQVFLLTLGFPVLIQLYYLFTVVNGYYLQPDGSKDLVGRYLDYIPVMCLMAVIPVIAWLWSVGTGLQDRIPEAIRMNTRWFTYACIGLLLFYIFFFTVFMPDLFVPAENRILVNNGKWMTLLIPVYALSGIGIIYIFLFVAKTIKTAERQARVRFGGYLWLSFLFWLFPLGVWIAQARVRKMGRWVHNEPDMALML